MPVPIVTMMDACSDQGPCAILGGSRAMALIYVKQGCDLSRLSGNGRNADPPARTPIPPWIETCIFSITLDGAP